MNVTITEARDNEQPDPFAAVQLQCKYPDLFKAICRLDQCIREDWVWAFESARDVRQVQLHNEWVAQQPGALPPDRIYEDPQLGEYGTRRAELQSRMLEFWHQWGPVAHPDRHYSDEERRQVTEEDYAAVQTLRRLLEEMREPLSASPPGARGAKAVERFRSAADNVLHELDIIAGYRNAEAGVRPFTYPPGAAVNGVSEASRLDPERRYRVG